MSDDRQTATDGNSRTAARQWSAKNTQRLHTPTNLFGLYQILFNKCYLAHCSYKTSYCMLRMTSAMNTNRDHQKIYTPRHRIWYPRVNSINCCDVLFSKCFSAHQKCISESIGIHNNSAEYKTKAARLRRWQILLCKTNTRICSLGRLPCMHTSHPRVLPLPTDIYSVLCKTNLQVGLEVGLQ